MSSIFPSLNLDLPVAVTGATSGIGKATVELLVKSGFTVYGLARRKYMLDQLEENLTNFKGINVDLMDSKSFTDQLRSIPTLGGLVTSHGERAPGPPVHQLTSELMHETLDSHLVSVSSLLSYLLVNRKLASGSSLIFVSSISSRAGTRGMSRYSAAKSALDGFMRSVADELSRKRIRVNSICPNIIDTPMHQDGNGNTSWIYDRFKKMPLGIGQTEDVAAACLYLLSKDSAYMTGQQLVMSGLGKWTE